MNTFDLTRFGFRPLILASAVAALSACGGGSGGGTASSEAVTTRGVITELGSIWVNGVEYETPAGASYRVDDSAGSGSDFKVGMVVSLKGRRNDDGISGEVTEVDFENEIEGTWDNSTDTINGIKIITTTTTVIEGWDGSSNDPLEVSGFWLDDSTLEATFIKSDDDGDGEDELKGSITQVNSTTEFVLRGFTITHNSGLTLSAGDLVEVHLSSVDSGAKTATASLVEIEDDFFDDDDGVEIEFEGIVSLDTTGCDAAADIKIDDTCVDILDSAEFEDGLLDINDVVENSRVEIEGIYDQSGDLFLADKVKGRGNRVRIETDDFANATTTSIDLFPSTGADKVTVIIDPTMTDDVDYDPSHVNGFRMRGIRIDASTVMATRIEDRSPSADELRGPVADIEVATPPTFFKVVGVTVQAASLGSFEEIEIGDVTVCDDDGVTSAPLCTQTDLDTFFSSLLAEDVVEAEGSYNPTTHTLTATKLEIELEDD